MRTLLILTLVLSGCGRDPSPAAGGESPEPETTPTAAAEAPATPPPTGVHGGPAGAMPSGHPPTGAMPPGHPPSGGAIPGTIPGGPTGATGPDNFDPAHPQVAGVAWTVAAPFEYRRPNSRMRAAEYIVPEAAEGERPATMTVHFFPGMGGSNEANIDRWVGQFQNVTGEPSRASRTSNGLEVHTVDVSGSFGGMQMPGQAANVQREQRLLGAIVVGPTGPLFFKFVGPSAVVGRGAQAFEAMLGTFAPAN